MGGINAAKLFDRYLEQNGIGHKATDVRHSGTFVSEDFRYVLLYGGGYSDPDKNKCVWVIKKEALDRIPLKIEVVNTAISTSSNEIEFADVIPLRYVEYLLVSDDEGSKILEKYGPDNTEIFGRPLKDVIIKLDGVYRDEKCVIKFIEARISALGLTK